MYSNAHVNSHETVPFNAGLTPECQIRNKMQRQNVQMCNLSGTEHIQHGAYEKGQELSDSFSDICKFFKAYFV